MSKTVKQYIGIDLGGTNIKFGVVNTTGEIVQKLVLPSNTENGPDAVIDQIKIGVAQLIALSSNPKGLGIGAPGVVNAKKRTVSYPPNFPNWENVNLGKILEKKFVLPVYIENDANAAAVGEMMFGAGRGQRSFIMITLGTGVGGGIILKRKLYRGESGAAGEIGHVSIDFNGPQCNCGSRGCIESYVGNKYLVERVSAELGKHPSSKIIELIDYDLSKLTPKIICEAAQKDDDYAKCVIADTGAKIGYALASVCNLLDITTIIIGGGVAGFGLPLFAAIETAVKERVITSLSEKIKVLAAQLENEAGIIGASALVAYHRSK
jgi:glucokinase